MRSGEGERTIVLLHGFPQTSHEWLPVASGLVDAGFTMNRSVPTRRRHRRSAGRYDKRTMAQDIRALVHDHLGIEGRSCSRGTTSA